MHRGLFSVPSLLLVIAAALVVTSCETLDTTSIAPAGDDAGFATTVKPIFEHRCVYCHNDEKANAGLNVQNRELVLSPAPGFVIPGKPSKSRLYTAVTRDPDHMKIMPADGWPITQSQVDAIRVWIAAGAPWPEGRAGKVQKKDYRIEIDDYL